MSTSNTKKRLGLVGAGGIAQAYSQAIGQIGELAQLVAVADNQLERATALAAHHGAVAYSDHREMVEAGNLDGVIICTPPSLHPVHCIDFLRGGVHTLCEKPVAINLYSARQIIAVAEEMGLLFSMASKFRFVPEMKIAKQLIDDRVMGDIILFENVFAGQVDMSKRWNSQPEISGGGVLIDNGTHSLDIMRYLLGPLSDIKVVEGKRIQHLPVEDTVHIFARTYDGVLGSIDLSWSLNKPAPNYVNLYGSLGNLNLGWKSSQYKLHGATEPVIIGRGYNKVEAFSNQLANFCLAISGQQSLLVQPEEALASVAAVETAYKSLNNMQWELIGV
ncbi:MAG: Gfo/Idh/MocA family oxidoreductase [Pirellulaceae bacterium]